jgi:hypothetical protein
VAGENHGKLNYYLNQTVSVKESFRGFVINGGNVNDYSGTSEFAITINISEGWFGTSPYINTIKRIVATCFFCINEPIGVLTTILVIPFIQKKQAATILSTVLM